MAAKFASVDDYLSALPDDQQEITREVRRTVLAALPDPGEKISYNIPAVTVGGKVLVYYAAWKKFVSLYPAPRADDDFERAVAPYRGAKDALQFRWTEPIPHDLITRVVRVLHEQRGR
ncbi:uncharacterized protein YdhG (YjbR/CyaY superfamily) [Asanoa ferruginea]|uniref:Uncharacterized protein YdhG (YjbR/CyaY superfamily) n=1 Tax=Asanoa ferruginea TaxID=53367 RepID=A0A3D9ZEN9_9ACTN|nr:DUF1801 domain-containing protein [Asanoa ferruginea]REF95715.1 uncharacterized protein YdhG (YjbR/CyaY superfamily) [Asanoa ferruginea]GIF51774.1 hypothetical protein Afe04nite_63130 [Asanoa ferruginea]